MKFSESCYKYISLYVAAFILSGCATVIGTDTSFKAWRGDQTFKGKGGTLEVFEGVEFWGSGEPPKEYEVIGVISQQKSDGTLDDLMFGKFNRQQIIDIVRREGGDGVVEVKNDRFVSGYTTNQYSPVAVSPEYSTSSVMAVFRYVSSNE